MEFNTILSFIDEYSIKDKRILFSIYNETYVKHNLEVTRKLDELTMLIKDIEKLRDNLNNLIKRKECNLQDPEVIAASRLLNAAITEYNKIIKEKL